MILTHKYLCIATVVGDNEGRKQFRKRISFITEKPGEKIYEIHNREKYLHTYIYCVHYMCTHIYEKKYVTHP